MPFVEMMIRKVSFLMPTHMAGVPAAFLCWLPP